MKDDLYFVIKEYVNNNTKDVLPDVLYSLIYDIIQRKTEEREYSDMDVEEISEDLEQKDEDINKLKKQIKKLKKQNYSLDIKLNKLTIKSKETIKELRDRNTKLLMENARLKRSGNE